MRKFISLGMIVGLLIVSSSPMVSASEICGTDALQKHAASAMPPDSTHIATHDPVLDLPADICRLECGCGCHSSSDTLPLLLTPHAVSLCALDMVQSEDADIVASPNNFSASEPLLSTPPPRKA
jgi:hypothetical protein